MEAIPSPPRAARSAGDWTRSPGGSRPRTSSSTSPALDWAIDVTAITGNPLLRAPRANSTTAAPRPLAEKTMTASFGSKWKLERITSARPGMRSMNIAWRWPLAPTTCV